MKKSLKTLLVIGVLFSITNIHADFVKVFALNDQDFSKVTSKKSNAYKLNDNLKLDIRLQHNIDKFQFIQDDGDNHNDGFIRLYFKNPVLKNWSFTEDVSLDNDHEGENRYLKFVDENNVVFYIRVKGQGSGYSTRLDINNEYEIDIKGKRLLGIDCVNGKFSFYINNELLHTSHMPFGKLKYISQNFYNYLGRTKKDTDVLYDMTLSEIIK